MRMAAFAGLALSLSTAPALAEPDTLRLQINPDMRPNDSGANRSRQRLVHRRPL